MKYLSTAVCAAAILAAGPALAADNPAWTYGQAQYTSFTSGDDNADQWGIDLSMGIADLYHVQVSYFDGDNGTDWDDDGTDNYDGWRLIAGVHPAISDRTDAVFNLRYTSVDTDHTNRDSSAWGLGAGLRHMLTDNFELAGMINWDRGDVDHDSDSDFTTTSWEVGGRYLFNNAVSAGLTYNDGSGWGASSLKLDVRYQFADFF
ncbi:MAG: hypothetical protein H3C57_00925 [Gammaproteobacteria bacterium]|nr:hypothetical protein [Gammaproteobacteria bacterium]